MKKALFALIPFLANCSSAATTQPAATPEAPPPAPVATEQPAQTPPPAVAEAPPPPPPPDPATVLGDSLHHHPVGIETMGTYAVLTPPGYSDEANAKTKYPIVVILHDAGSNELQAGMLANGLGREGVIYVLPRSPYPAEAKGWQAAPTYPSDWGAPGSATFPTKEVDQLKLAKAQTKALSDAIKDVRKNYRATHDKIILLGNGEGALAALDFASTYPWMTKAYFAYDGQFDQVVADKNAKSQAFALRNGKIATVLATREGGEAAKSSAALNELLTSNKVDSTTLNLPAGEGALAGAARDEAKRYIRHWCCDEALTPPEAPPAPAQPSSAVADSSPAPAAAPASPAAAPAAPAPAAAPPAPAAKTAVAPAAAPAPAPAAPAANPTPAQPPQTTAAAPAKTEPPKKAADPAPEKAPAPARDIPAKATKPAK